MSPADPTAVPNSRARDIPGLVVIGVGSPVITAVGAGGSGPRGVPPGGYGVRGEGRGKSLYHAYCDGACRGNPGPGAAAAYINPPGPVPMIALSKYSPATTNNRAELAAVILALRAIPVGEEVTVHSDSQVTIYGASGQWKRKANLDLWELLDHEADLRQVTWEWHRRNSLPPLAWADRLANKVAGL